MTDAAAESAPPPPPRRRLPLIIGAVLALLLGGGGFYAVYSGAVSALLPGSGSTAPGLGDSAFVPMEPLMISLSGPAQGRHLRFTATLEVPRREQSEVARMLPRIADVLNGYLRAVDPEDFDAPGALIRMRAQMLRRVQIVTGEERVRDLLVTEFVLN